MSSYRSFSELEEEDNALEDDLIVSKPESGHTTIKMPVRRGLASFDDVIDYSIRKDLGEEDDEDDEEEEFIANSEDAAKNGSKFLQKYVNGDEDMTEEERRQCRMHKIILLILAGGLTLFALILVFAQYGKD